MRAAEVNEPPTFVPLYVGAADRVTFALDHRKIPSPLGKSSGFRFRDIRDYRMAYRKGAVTPEPVAERPLAANASRGRLPAPVRAFIAYRHDDVMSQAREATRRHPAV